MSETVELPLCGEDDAQEPSLGDAVAIATGIAMSIYSRLTVAAERGEPIAPDMLALARAQAQHALGLMEQMVREFRAGTEEMDAKLASYAQGWLANVPPGGRA